MFGSNKLEKKKRSKKVKPDLGDKKTLALHSECSFTCSNVETRVEKRRRAFEMTKAKRKAGDKGGKHTTMEHNKHAGSVYWEDECHTDETNTTATPSVYGIDDEEVKDTKGEQGHGDNYCDDDDEEDGDEEQDDDEYDDDEEDTDTCSSFSLQECIDEFRARRVRRISTQSREAPLVDEIDDKDLVEQNRSNKEQEKKCKPCKNGFCYCFTSDSGDGGCSVTGTIPPMTATSLARAAHMRRNRKSDFPQPGKTSGRVKEHKKRSSSMLVYKEAPLPEEKQIPASPRKEVKEVTTSRLPITAISRLETSKDDAPLIHIIQELHDNCVISEVRVNKEKVEAHQRALDTTQPIGKICNFNDEPNKQILKDLIVEIIKSSPKKVNKQSDYSISYQPSAPPLDTIIEQDSSNDMDIKGQSFEMGSLQSKGPRMRHKLGGRLLEKRLSYSGFEYKPKDYTKPPRKPPRLHRHQDNKYKMSSSESTTPSLRKAEQIIDKFLEERGIPVPNIKKENPSKEKKTCKNKTNGKELEKLKSYTSDKRKSYPITEKLTSRNTFKKPLRTYPSLSDIEHFMDETKKSTNYEKNIRKDCVKEKPIKEVTLGWATPKIFDMLNCDTNGNCKEFKSQAVQAGPQTIGWQVPPKMSLDTVDSPVQSNLATNMEKKDTPSKSPQVTPQKNQKQSSQSFIWGEQFFEKLSSNSKDPNKLPKKSNLKKTSTSFLQNSKKKILRLVTPKKDNKKPQSFKPRKTPLRSIAIQTSREDLNTPPGSYRSANHQQSAGESVQPSLASTPSSIINNSSLQEPSRDTFDFTRVVQSPPKKSIRRTSQRKLNFPLSCGNGVCLSKNECSSGNDTQPRTKTYHSYNAELEQDLTLSKMNYVLNNIRARLEASDDRAVKTFQEVERREQQRIMSFDCPDSFHSHGHGVHHRRSYSHEIEPIYSEIEEDSLHIASSPQFDNRTEPKVIPKIVDTSALYATVNKPPKKHKAVTVTSAARTVAATLVTPIAATIAIPTAPSISSTIASTIATPIATPTATPIATPIATPTATPTAPSVSSSIATSISVPTDKVRVVPMPLGKFIQDSLRHRQVRVTTSPEQTSSEPSLLAFKKPTISEKNERSSSMTSSLATDAPLCQSLNNIRVMEHNSPPKKNRNLSKSDLSLHRSEIFLENLYRSEIVLGNESLMETKDNLRKQSRDKLNDSYHSIENPINYIPNQHHPRIGSMDESVSYELPPQDRSYDNVDGCTNTSTAGSQIIFSTPQKNNQSTPKKTQTFTTKPAAHLQHSSLSKINGISQLNEEINAFPSTPSPANHLEDQHQYSFSSSEVGDSNTNQNPKRSLNENNASTVAGYKRLKRALSRSFRKSKDFVKNETKRLSQSLSLPGANASNSNAKSNANLNPTDCPIYVAASSLYLEQLFAMDEHLPVEQQLVQAVSICRQMPNLEISPEMVEAERLLLFSTLKGNKRRHLADLKVKREQSLKRFYIDEMRLPVKADPSQDIFFNYFYIVTFECGGVIKSSQSVECQNGEAFFKDCGIEFECIGNSDDNEADIRCEIFMLRLRKVSTLSLEPPKRLKLSKLSPTSSGCSSSDIVSRFRPHASFTLKDLNFVPYEYVEKPSQDSDKLCLRTSNLYEIPIQNNLKTTNLASEIFLKARVEIRLPKLKHEGFLNVEDPLNQHNWNRRWCTLDGITLSIWQDSQSLEPLLSLNLRSCSQNLPLECAPRELCARPRAFCLQSSLRKADEDTGELVGIFFSAETNQDLNQWLLQINTTLTFISSWIA